MPYVTSHDTEIYFETHGEGPLPIVFAHGMGGNAAIWFNQIAGFVGEHRIVTFDHRYFGRSRCNATQFDPRLFVDDVMAVMDAAEVPRAVFVCQSMGGWTGSQMALLHPERVQGLVMSHTPGVFVSEHAESDPKAVAEFVSAPPGRFASGALAEDFPRKNLAAAILYGQISSFNDIDPAVIPRRIAAAGLSQDTAELSSYNVPTLFISANHDKLFPPDYLQALADSLPGAQFVNLGDAGHSSYFELPEAFNEVLAQFIGTLS